MKRFPLPDTARMFAERSEGRLGDWPMAKPRLVVKWLCASCNNGWMSQLEAETKPIIEDILDDNLKEIGTAAQSTLALWAVKTAMVLEALNPDRPWFFSAEERAEMRTTRSLPDHTSVWIAKCVNQPNIYSAAKDHRTAPGNDGVRAFSVTMAFGSLAFQVVTIKPPLAIPQSVTITYDVSEGPWDQTLVRVWPTSEEPRAWPSKYGLDGDLGLHALTERLNSTAPGLTAQ